MGFRRILAATVLVVCGTGLMAGCPQIGGLIDSVLSEFGSDAAYGDVPDGTYSGTKYATTKYWQAGDEYWSGDWNEPVALEFAKGAIVQPSGYWLDYGDVDSLDMGTLQVSREVDEINFLDWGYEVLYELTGTWGDVPLEGGQHVDYVTNADGSITIYDTIELFSLDSHDGGAWEILIEAEGTLAPSGGAAGPGSSGNSGGPLDDDILDKKSGKIRR